MNTGGGGGQYTDPRRRQEEQGEFINYILVSLLLQITPDFNEGYVN